MAVAVRSLLLLCASLQFAGAYTLHPGLLPSPRLAARARGSAVMAADAASMRMKELKALNIS